MIRELRQPHLMDSSYYCIFGPWRNLHVYLEREESRCREAMLAHLSVVIQCVGNDQLLQPPWHAIQGDEDPGADESVVSGGEVRELAF